MREQVAAEPEVWAQTRKLRRRGEPAAAEKMDRVADFLNPAWDAVETSLMACLRRSVASEDVPCRRCRSPHRPGRAAGHGRGLLAAVALSSDVVLARAGSPELLGLCGPPKRTATGVPWPTPLPPHRHSVDCPAEADPLSPSLPRLLKSPTEIDKP
jgi:hypothetical protein